MRARRKPGSDPGRPTPGPRGAPAALLALVCLSAVVAVGPTALAADQVIGKPVLSVSAPNNQVSPGESTTLDLQIANEGKIQQAGPAAYVDRVTTARATRVEVTSGDSPIQVETGEYPVGTVPTGTTGPIPIRITVPEDAPVGTYQLPVRVRYQYTSIVDYGGESPEYSDSTYNQVQTVTVRVTKAPRFELVSANTSARVGDRGTLSVAIRNAGAESVHDVTLTLTSQSSAMTFGGDASASSVVGRWGAGQVHELDVPVDVAPGAPVRPYAVDATIDYVRENGTPGSKTLTTTVTPRGAPSFSVSSVESTLRVGTSGTVRARIENTGETTARDAVVRFSVPWSNRTQTDSVGDVAPGAGVDVRFSSTVPYGIDPGRQRVTFVVDHAASTGARRLSEPLGASVQVAPRRSPIAVEPVDATFEVDSDGPLRVRLTNRAGGPITDVRAVLSSTDPLTSDDPVAYVPRLAAGESTTVSFHLDVSDKAVPGDHPVSLSFTYDDADGTTRNVSDVPVGVTVVRPSGPGFPVEALVVAVVAVAGGAFWWYRRR